MFIKQIVSLNICVRCILYIKLKSKFTSNFNAVKISNHASTECLHLFSCSNGRCLQHILHWYHSINQRVVRSLCQHHLGVAYCLLWLTDTCPILPMLIISFINAVAAAAQFAGGGYIYRHCESYLR